MVENRHPEALELGMIDDSSDVDGLTGIANARADSQGHILWKKNRFKFWAKGKIII